MTGIMKIEDRPGGSSKPTGMISQMHERQLPLRIHIQRERISHQSIVEVFVLGMDNRPNTADVTDRRKVTDYVGWSRLMEALICMYAQL